MCWVCCFSSTLSLYSFDIFFPSTDFLLILFTDTISNVKDMNWVSRLLLCWFLLESKFLFSNPFFWIFQRNPILKIFKNKGKKLALTQSWKWVPKKYLFSLKLVFLIDAYLKFLEKNGNGKIKTFFEVKSK